MSAASLREYQQAAAAWQRNRLAGVLYPIAWLPVLGVMQAFARDPAVAAATLLLFTLAAIVRAMPAPAVPTPAAQRRWWFIAHAVRLVSPLMWIAAIGALAGDPRFEPAARIIVLCSLVLAMAEAHGSSARWPVALVAVAAAFLPALSALRVEPDYMPWAYGLAAYAGWLCAVVVHGMREQRAMLALLDELRRQRELAEQQARIDGLTGLCNRREFRARCDAEIERALEDGRPLSLLVLDLDHFKHVNGEYGHATGDATLAALADRIRVRFAGAHDVVARLGGEEFAVLLPDRSEGEAAVLAEALLADLRGRPLDADGERLTITASIGVGGFRPADHPDVDALLGAVDRAMYRAKAAGRARVCRVEAVAAVH